MTKDNYRKCSICEIPIWDNIKICNSCRLAVAYEQARIIKLLEEPYFLEPLANALISLSDLQFKLPDGNDVVEINFAIQAIYEYTHDLIALIKGEK